MDTSSRIVPRPTLTLLRQEYDCPSWCERTDHEADLVDANNPPRHYGPDWGLLNAQAAGRAEALVLVADPEAYGAWLSAPDLRKLAADSLSAAEWLEARA